MCGIAGIICLEGSPPCRERLRGMLSVIAHRGPDNQGEFFDKSVALGMRRLSIIDVAGGRQPYSNEDGTVHAVFNGEIYNFKKLRQDLGARFHTFHSATDGEVITHLWEEYGAGFANHMNGMFAIALYDQQRQKIVLVRDRLGIKPLYYAFDGNHLVFGSEIKSILASQIVARDLDVDSLGQFMAWEYVPGDRTLFRAIRKLRPGEMLTLDVPAGCVAVDCWWDIDVCANGASQPTYSRAEWEDIVDAKLQECVRRQLVSDVPLGAFLSGGVDSSLIVAAMGESHTYSIGFDDASYNELPYARRVAEVLGVHHRDEVIRPDVVALFEHLMNFMEDPIADVSIFPTYLVSRLAREEVKVVLSGDGGDELFGGYDTYVAQNLDGLWRRMPSALRHNVLGPAIDWCKPTERKKGFINKAQRFLEGAKGPSELGHARWRLYTSELMRHELFTPDALATMSTSIGEHILELGPPGAKCSPTDHALYTDVKSYLCDNILTKVDRMSMACSLEARVPYLDHELVELAFQIPSEFKIRGNRTKVLLKSIAARYVPQECVYRKKEGFSIPMKQWLRTTFLPLMNELLNPHRIASEGIFNAHVVEGLKREHLAGLANHAHILWSMIVFQDWRRRWSV
jgi:asparagine synthase (glutamine-hydrolysing)